MLGRLRPGLLRLEGEWGAREVQLVFHVAFMSYGVAGSDWESLKRNENCCDMMQHENGSAAKAKPLKKWRPRLDSNRRPSA